MAKIVRTPTKASGGITPAEREQMRAHSDMWITRAMRTDPIDMDKIVPAIEGLYAAAGLKTPRVVIVPSPLVMAFAYGASAAIWHCRKTYDATYDATDAATDAATRAATYDATRAATDAATYAATDDATDDATYAATYAATDAATGAATDAATDAATRAATDAATYDATRAATDAATYAATDDATYAATRAATDAATDAATYDATRAATYDATRAATDAATYAATGAATDAATRAATRAATYAATGAATDAATDAATRAATACLNLAGPLGLSCASYWWRSYQGGNMWAAYDCYLTAARDILGMRLPAHEAYRHWEQAAIHGGFRVMHPEFCIVSDFPDVLRVDAQNRPHSEDGPSHRWRDGWCLYHWHGVRVPDHWIADRADLSAAEVLRHENTEVRRAGCEILGWARIIESLGGRVIAADADPQIGTLIEVDLPDNGPARFLRVQCGTGREFALCVPNDVQTPIEAQAALHGLSVDDFTPPSIRT